MPCTQFDINNDGIIEPGEIVEHAKSQLTMSGQEPTKARIMQYVLRHVARLGGQRPEDLHGQDGW